MLRVLDLFSGIGAFSLGLERAGMRTVAFCEIEPFARRVLARHWPDVHIFGDVRELSAQHLSAKGLGVDLICGGFPCTDISVAGRGAGINGEQSRLWREFARLIGEIRPRYAIVENVSALLGRGLGDVLGDLAALGYDAEWHCIPAAAVGAPHIRDRIWIVAYASSAGRQQITRGPHGDEGADEGWTAFQANEPASHGQGHRAWYVDDATGERREAVGMVQRSERRSQPERRGGEVANTGIPRLSVAVTQDRHAGLLSEADIRYAAERCGWWAVEPDVGRVAHGVASRVDRLRCLGNSLVPQIPELIGRAILAWERAA